MIIDTKEIDNEFITIDIDGFILVNSSEIGITVANELIDREKIDESDIYNFVETYLSEIQESAVNKAIEVLEENNKKIERWFE